MISVVTRQLILGLLVVFSAITLTFALVRVSGDPTSIILPPDATEEQRALLRQSLGIDVGLGEQYLTYLANAARGEFGNSYFDGESVSTIILRYLPNTLVLAGLALAIGIALGIPLGVVAAIKRGGFVDRAVQFISVIGTAMPTFWVGLLLIQVFAVGLGLLPTYGIGSPAHLVLPTATLVIYIFPGIARLTRSSMLEVLPAGYVNAARAKGMPEWRVITRTVFRNGVVPILALLAIDVGTLIGGAVLTETVFSWPGIGRLAIGAIQRRDFPIVQGVVAYVAVMFVILTVLTEIAVRLVNPRLREP